MKKSLLSLLLLTNPFFLYPQNYAKKTPGEKAGYYTREMTRDLQLDSTTAALVYDINLQVSTAFDSLYKLNPEKEAARSGAVRIYKKRDSMLKRVLTPIQFLKFDDIQREKSEKRKKEKDGAKEHP